MKVRGLSGKVRTEPSDPVVSCGALSAHLPAGSGSAYPWRYNCAIAWTSVSAHICAICGYIAVAAGPCDRVVCPAGSKAPQTHDLLPSAPPVDDKTGGHFQSRGVRRRCMVNSPYIFRNSLAVCREPFPIRHTTPWYQRGARFWPTGCFYESTVCVSRPHVGIR